MYVHVLLKIAAYNMMVKIAKPIKAFQNQSQQ